MFRKHDKAESSLTEWPQWLILVNAVLWLEALSFQDFVVPVRLGFCSREVDRPLLGRWTDEQEAVKCLPGSRGGALHIFFQAAPFHSLFFRLCVIRRRLAWDALERAQLVVYLRLLRAMWPGENEVRVRQNQFILFEAVRARFEVTGVEGNYGHRWSVVRACWSFPVLEWSLHAAVLDAQQRRLGQRLERGGGLLTFLLFYCLGPVTVGHVLNFHGYRMDLLRDQVKIAAGSNFLVIVVLNV